MKLAVGTGFTGAFTTFSTFAYETIQMLQRKENRPAVIYAGTSVAFSILFVWIGQYIGRIV
ncbi:CrcB family protein [Brevibacillus nitrificans]|nr:CrcB family protein [Brevibacillus nitrificans]MED1792238.1 CrcB family protein [Brevibacillus nitrificans]